MASKPGIKTFSKCFKEMKRLSGDTISDERINEFLDEIKKKLKKMNLKLENKKQKKY